MTLPIRHLPVLQNWDCHQGGSCCKEYQVTITPEEKERIEKQGWDPQQDLGGHDLFRRVGPPWARRYQLNHREDGSCVFLGEAGRCRIHERFGYETKPLPCRLFPFVLIPRGDHWGVSVRFACPSAAENKGRALAGHDPELREFAEMLARRENLSAQPDGSLLPPPALEGGKRVSWPDLLLYVDALLAILQDRPDSFERRLRRCLAFAQLCKQAKTITAVTGNELKELLSTLSHYAEVEVPANPANVGQPSWIGRILFRQALAVFTRKDHGPNRGPDIRGRGSLLQAAWGFARGTGAIPRMHGWIPETTFEQIEGACSNIAAAEEELLERYYVIKVGSLQFCGGASFGLSFWEGFTNLMLTFPILLWVARALQPRHGSLALTRAVSIVDDHVGFNRVLGTLRQRTSFRILASRGELPRLIASYSR